MNHKNIRSLAAVLCAAIAVSVSIAHVDDPKARDLLPPVFANPYRASEGGVAAETFESTGLVLKSWLPLNVFPGGATNGNDCWGYAAPSHREYAIIGLSNGTAFVEVTDPGNAQVVAHIPGPNSLWRCVKTFGKYCYAGSEGGGGIQVMDMGNIDGQNAAAPRVSLVNTITTGGEAKTHTVFIDAVSGYLYRAGGGSNGIRVYNLQPDPANPVYVGQWGNVYVHEAQIVTYTSGPYAGKQIAFCSGGASGGNVNTGMYIVDVTNKANMQQMSYTTYPGARYCHQSWLSNDQQRIYINDELDEGATVNVTTTIVMNVANLSAPVVEPSFTNGNAAIGHNLYIKGNLLYEANYRSGLRVFDLAQSAGNPPEVAFFDTWPGDDLPQFNALWNVWPYFPSGTIIGSDINRGLFVWRMGTSPGIFSFPNGLPELISPAGQLISIEVDNVQGQTVPPNGVVMRIEADRQVTLQTMFPVGHGVFVGQFPEMPCMTPVQYSFEIHVGQEVYPDPSGEHSALVAAGTPILVDDACELQGAWALSTAGDNATTGVWINADPVGTTAQPENDHTANGTKCFVTGNAAPGEGVGTNDIDNGTTTLTSPVFDGSGLDAHLSYWRWYSNDQGSAANEDTMPVMISNDGGATWQQLELVSENAGAWVFKSYRISDFIAPSTQMRLRFIARDLGTGSVVEAGVDDLQVFAFDCTRILTGDFDRNGVVDGADLGTLLAAWGQPGETDLDGSGVTDGSDLGLLLGFWTSP